jgi:molybdate transport system permease protein
MRGRVIPPSRPRPVEAEANPRTTKGAALLLPALAIFCFLVAPLLALLLQAVPALAGAGPSPLVVDALRLSLLTTLATTLLAIVLGTPTAYLLARYRFRGQAILETLIDLPMVLPPAVAGLALLMAFGRRGLLGGALALAGISLPFTTVAVIMAQTFVAAPFYIRAARAGFAAVNPRLEQMAATLGVSDRRIFWQVTLPLARRSLISGAIMTWARALGEFGATIMFAGNLQGRTQTMPLAIYIGLQEDLGGALALAGILLAVSFGLLIAVRLIGRRGMNDVAG